MIKFSPIANQNKPFRLFSKRFKRDELKNMGLDKYAHDAILKYYDIMY